ncbi:MAG: transporter substrate-binding domain-containing protein [Leptolyngbya sp. SIO3F4]|nr:transporter substrate-binding domain-containing protein [Leptolyngbya sp. SIO3F4]
MIRHLGIIAMLIGVWPFAAFGQSTKPAITLSANAQPEQAIRVGTKEIPPFIFIKPSVQPYGYSADLWQAIADDLALQTEWVTYPSVTAMLDGLQTGEVDVAIAGISVTAQREANGLDFS